MNKKYLKIIFLILYVFLFTSKISNAEVVSKIEVIGNDRISKETIILFSDININEILNEKKLNNILINLYNTTFFKDIQLNFVNNVLKISVKENPIIENIEYNGVRSSKLLELLKQDALVKSRYSFDEVILSNEKKRLKKFYVS